MQKSLVAEVTLKDSIKLYTVELHKPETYPKENRTP